MPTVVEPLPDSDPVVDADTRLITPVWYRYLSTAIVARLSGAPLVARMVTVANHGASIGATSLSQGSFGLYRVSWVLRITQAATVSSQATVTIANTDAGVNVAQVAPAVTGNTTTTVQSGSVLVRADAATAITYAVAYTSVGATPMLYTISVAIEAVSV
jgi:hypothetical protein